MATFKQTRRYSIDLAEATYACAAATRALGESVTIEVENPGFGLVIARRTATPGADRADGEAGSAERYRWELWPVERGVTEIKLLIEADGVSMFARGRLKEIADWLFDRVGEATAALVGSR